MMTPDPTILFTTPSAPVQSPSPRHHILLREHAMLAPLLYISTQSSFHTIQHLYFLHLPQKLLSASFLPHILLLTTVPSHHEGSFVQRRDLASAAQLARHVAGA